MQDYLALVKHHPKDDHAVNIIDDSDIAKVIYNGKACNIMDVAGRYKGNYCMDFKDKSGRAVHYKMSCIPVRLCEFPDRELVLTVVYGFGAEPMLLLSSLKMQEKKKLCHIIAKVYLPRWRIEEYFRFSLNWNI